MADLVVNPALVVAGVNATIDRRGVAGEAIAAGKLVYRDPATKRYKLSDSNATDPVARRVDAISLNSAAFGQPLAVHEDGDLTLGATMVPGTAYFLSDTPGGVCTLADLAGDEYVVLIGLARSASVLAVDVQHSYALAQGGGDPVAPEGFQILLGADGAFVTGADGAPLYGVAA